MEITKEILKDLYINQGLTVRECAEKLGLPTHGGISWRLKKYGIKTRPNRFQTGNQVNKGRQRFGSENPNWKGGKTELSVCIDCKTEFYTRPSEKDNYQRCEDCRIKNQISNDLKGQRFGLLTVVKEEGRLKWEGGSRRLWLCKCDCGKEHTVRANELKNGRTKSCGCGQGQPGEKNPKWIGGKSAISFDTYAHQIQFAEDVRRSPDNNAILEVQCTFCKKWFRPSLSQVSARIRSLYGQKGATGECRLYCSDACKEACPVFNFYPSVQIDPRSKVAIEKSELEEVRRCQTDILKQLQCDEFGYNFCERCGDIIDSELHHTLPIAEYGTDAINPATHMILCVGCHTELHRNC